MNKEKMMNEIKSVVKEIIDQKIYSLIGEIDGDNEFRDRVVDESWNKGVFVEDHYEVVKGEIIDMESKEVKDFVDYLTNKWTTRISVNNEPLHNWGVGGD